MKFCRERFSTTVHSRLSWWPAFGNEALKTSILEWGFGDASIATSQFRHVLRAAVVDTVRYMAEDAGPEPNPGAALSARAAAPGVSAQRMRTRLEAGGVKLVSITRSLGSYVLWDAVQTEAGRVICASSQIHMLANQLALLRLSDIDYDLNPDPATKAIQKTGDFRAACLGQSVAVAPVPGEGTAVGALQTVAYHDPSDLLTYYTSQPPGAVGNGNEIINVIKHYALTWIPTIWHSPMHAHTGQSGSDVLMDWMVNGRQQ